MIASRRGPQIGDAMPELACTTTSMAAAKRFKGSMSGLKRARMRAKAFFRLRWLSSICKHCSTVAGALKADCCAGYRALVYTVTACCQASVAGAFELPAMCQFKAAMVVMFGDRPHDLIAIPTGEHSARKGAVFGSMFILPLAHRA